MNSEEIIDIQELKEIMGDDHDLIKECFDEFRSEWPKAFSVIERAVKEKNARELDEAAHKLKGSLRYLAASKAQKAAYDLEAAGKNRKLENLEKKLALLNKRGLEVIDYINNYGN